MKIIKCYENYKELKKSLKSRTYNLTDDSIGQYNNGDYSVDITLREYDEDWCVDYDVYKVNGDKKYLDGGKVCDANKMPFTENGFWKLIKKRFEEHIK